MLAMSSAAIADPAKPQKLPQDFSFHHKSYSAGVIPKVEEFITIRMMDRDGKKSHMLISGVSVSDGENRPQSRIKSAKTLTPAQCLEFYHQAMNLGFFELKDAYTSDDISGGSVSTTSITADGVKKSVIVYESDVPQMSKLIAAAEAL